ncbi:MAG TPA: caspase family protein, partial [Acidobacteriota bacterium]|nr:caspase family protein [Acidobacteriota bacterium]
GIRTALNAIARNALAEDLVVIFLSSHGSPGKADLVGEGYLVTYDTEIADLYATAFPMRDFTRDVKQRIQAQRKVVFLDTCYSGQANAEGGKGIQMVGELQNQTAQDLCGFGSVVITSSSPHEQSWESPALQNGYFTYFLIQALRQENGYLSIDKVFSFLQDTVPQTVRKEKEATQTPRIMPQPLREAAEIKIGVKTN